MTDATQGRFDIQAERRMDSVEEYQFEPIKGYPMLHWHGKRPFTSTRYYPAQHKETHGRLVDGWRNKIYWGDNLQVMSHLLKEFRGNVKLVYIDPPFDSLADYKISVQLKGKRVSNEHNAFEEKQYTDIWTNDTYLQFMYERLILLRELLSDKGTFWLHCDYHKSHYLKCICDEIFGPSNFVTEVIWNRAAPRGNVKLGLSTAHDTILVYSKGTEPEWHPPLLEYSEDYKARFSRMDPDGRRYTTDNLISPNPDRPNLDYIWNGVRRVWRVTKDKMEDYERQGRIEYTSNGIARYKRYLDELEGRPMTTIWDDIYPVNSQAKERQNYPTQKPESLLQRVILTSTDENDLVFDCFMGSGTTQIVAMKLGRRYIGADINLGAIQTTTKRLLQGTSEMERKDDPQLALNLNNKNDGKSSTLYTGFEVYNVNHYDVFRNPVEAKELLIEALEINKLAPGHLFDGEKDGRLWKIMPVNRIATRQDLNELISNLDYRAFSKRYEEHPKQPVERITLVCMGHEPDLAAVLEKEVQPYPIDVEVLDILRDRQDIEFKRDSEARIVVQNGHLIIDAFYPMNLLSKLSLQKERVEDWRELVESIMIDWNYDGAILQPAVVDIPDKNDLVAGKYKIPADAGTIRLKITDLLSESLEQEVRYG
ncbi:MAG: site-specific DNA-methyltransferase [Anaerolineales bacterium]|nr:site-specific DNA-methyltransferase [Anaerolineales bacterium]MCB8939244.1 site-specific DNA-methyltransferase [Ardenticatenaceae bacterium]